MIKQQVIDHNLVNFDRLAAANYPKSVFLDDWNLKEPELGYLVATDSGLISRYTCIVYISDGTMIQFGFTNRNRLRNRIKHIQSVYNNIVARIIAEVKHE